MQGHSRRAPRHDSPTRHKKLRGGPDGSLYCTSILICKEFTKVFYVNNLTTFIPSKVTTLCGLVEARHEPVPRNDGARGARGCQAGGAGQEVEQRGPIQVARMVHNTYWVPEGRAVDAIAGTLRSGRWTRLQVVPLLFSKTYRRLPLHPPHRGGREGV